MTRGEKNKLFCSWHGLISASVCISHNVNVRLANTFANCNLPFDSRCVSRSGDSGTRLRLGIPFVIVV